jgi:hypothetical protein
MLRLLIQPISTKPSQIRTSRMPELFVLILVIKHDLELLAIPGTDQHANPLTQRTSTHQDRNPA